MAEKKAASGGKGLKKKLGPLPYWGWGAVGAGTFLVYRYLKARSAANANTAASGLTGGSLIPNDVGLPNPQNEPAGNFSSVAAWTQAALAFLTSGGMNPADALNAVTSWLNGNCVSQAAYNGLGQALASNQVGLPPGFTSVPTLSVCPSGAQTPTQGNPSPAPGGPGPVATVTKALADIDAQAWPLIVKFGQDPNAATDFTQIGVVNNGVYSGYNVTHGAPIYAGLLGGYAQDFNMSTLPNGTIIYAPSTLIQQGYLGSHT